MCLLHPTPLPYRSTASPEVPSSHELTSSRAVTPPSRVVVENGKTMACMYIGSCEVPRALGEVTYVYVYVGEWVSEWVGGWVSE